MLLEALAVPPAVALAVTLAWLTERTDLPLARMWSWLAVVPLAIPAFVHSYAWDGLFPWLRGLWPAVAISVLAYFPFVYLPVVAQLRRLDPAVEDVAASLGEPPARVFLRVVLPQLRLAIAGGALLIALHLLAEYGLFVLIRFDTLTTAIVDQFQAVYDGPAANLLGIVLVACGDGGARRSRPGSAASGAMPGSAPAPRGRRRGCRSGGPGRSGRWRRWRRPRCRSRCRSTVARALAGARRRRRPGTCRELGSTFGQTASYAVGGAALACLAALPVAWMSARAPGRLQRGLEACHVYVGSLPGVVVALALVAVTVARGAAALPDGRDAAGRLCPALPRPRDHRAPRQPRAGAGRARAGGGRARPAAAASPRSERRLRLAAPGIAAGMALVAMGITTELTATLMLSPLGTRTLATEFWVAHRRVRPRRRRALCAGDDPAVAAALRPPLPAGARGDRPMTALRLRGLGKRFGSVAALTGIDLDAATGTRTAVVGPSGSGKTTLLRLIAGFEAPDAGVIELDGALVADTRAAVPPHRRNIGLVMQDGALFPHLSVLDNIRFGMGRGEPDARALGLLDLVELDRANGLPPAARALRRAAAAGRARPRAGAASRPDAARRALLGARHGLARAAPPGDRRASSPRRASPPCSSPTTRPRR